MAAITVSAMRFLHGANCLAPHSTACCRIDLGQLDGWLDAQSPHEFRDFCTRYLGNSLTGELSSDSTLEIFASTVLNGTLALQRRIHPNVPPIHWHEVVSATQAEVFFAFEREDIAAGVFHYALDTLEIEIMPAARRTQGIMEKLRADRRRISEWTARYALNLPAQVVVDRALARGIPVEPIGYHAAIFGEGRYQQRRIRNFSDSTSHIAYLLTSNKTRALDLLRDRGIPVPKHKPTRTSEEAVAWAETTGYPVVVKPLNTDFGLGVSLNLGDSKSLAGAFELAAAHDRIVLVEQQIPGFDHRILVVDGKFVAAAGRRHAAVTGDGALSVRELVAALNADPRRGDKRTHWMTSVEYDDELNSVLSEQGYTLDSVPPTGQVVVARRVASMSRGGYAIDVSSTIHPDNIAVAEWAAGVFGIDVCGIDFVSPDIGVSYKENGGAICEVNISPALSPHVVADGQRVDVVDSILDDMYPPGSSFRIPKLLLISAGESDDTRNIAAAIRDELGNRAAVAGIACFGEVEIADQRLISRERTAPQAARLIVANPVVEFAIVLASAEDLAMHGFGLRECDGVVFVGFDEANLDDRASTLLAAARRITTHPPLFSNDPATIAGHIAATLDASA